MEIQTIHNEILQSCTYILYDNDTADCYLIDCGDIEPIESFLKSNGKRLKGIFLTHSHYDHIYGLNDIIKSYPELLVYASAETIEGLTDPDINLSYMYDDGDYVVESAKTVYTNSEEINILGLKVEVVSTPGHDTDCTSYIIDGSIFTGDAYNPDFEVFTKWRRSNPEDAGKSIDKILKLVEAKNLTIYPGHYK